jgi:GNAT superfamily N-acetyltransferase
MEWRLLRVEDFDAEPWLAQALEDFQPVDPEREADLAMADWLARKGPLADQDVWLLLDRRIVAAFHSAEPGQAELADLGLMNSVHMAFAARSGTHPGMGTEIVRHLEELARAEELDLITLDPLDGATLAVWQRHGFRDSLTPIQGDPTADLSRQYRRFGEPVP